MILADSNVVSEFMREAPDPRVLAWAATAGPRELTVSVVTVEEIERGIGRLPAGRRRLALEEAWSHLMSGFAASIVVYDVPAARSTARVLVDAEARGRPLSLADAQIAGICLANDLRLATRNVRDFADVSGLTFVNPFS